MRCTKDGTAEKEAQDAGKTKGDKSWDGGKFRKVVNWHGRAQSYTFAKGLSVQKGQKTPQIGNNLKKLKCAKL